MSCGVEILAVASALPERVVGNAAIADRLGVTDDWIRRRPGIRERRYAAPGASVADLAAAAARRALAAGDVGAAELDAVLVATSSADALMPNVAPLTAGRLGADRAAAIDVGAACTGWLSALAVAAGLIEAGRPS